MTDNEQEPTKPKRTRKRKQRGRGEDSIYQRASDGRWIVEIRVGHKPNGRPDIIYLTAKTKEDAKDKHRKKLAELGRGVPVTRGSQTLATYLSKWITTKVQPTKRTTTAESYESLVRVHLIPALGRIRLDQLTPADVQTMLATMGTHGAAPATVRNARSILRKALNDAMRDDLIYRNVVTLTDLPAQHTYQPKPLTEREMPAFLTAIKGHRLEGLFVAMLLLGLREGEAFGLTWPDIDLDRRTLAVHQQIQRVGKPKHPVLAEPKTERSRNAIPLPQLAIDALSAHRERQERERLIAGHRWGGNDPRWQGLVFTTTIGTPLDPSNVLRQYRALLREAGIDDQRRVHDLRHSTATALARMGVHPRVAQEILRHAQITTTMAVYTSVPAESTREALDRLSDAFSGKPAVNQRHTRRVQARRKRDTAGRSRPETG